MIDTLLSKVIFPVIVLFKLIALLASIVIFVPFEYVVSVICNSVFNSTKVFPITFDEPISNTSLVKRFSSNFKAFPLLFPKVKLFCFNPNSVDVAVDTGLFKSLVLFTKFNDNDPFSCEYVIPIKFVLPITITSFVVISSSKYGTLLFNFPKIKLFCFESIFVLNNSVPVFTYKISLLSICKSLILYNLVDIKFISPSILEFPSTLKNVVFI